MDDTLHDKRQVNFARAVTIYDLIRIVAGPDTFNSGCFCVKTFILYTFLYWRDRGVEASLPDRVACFLLKTAIRLIYLSQNSDNTIQRQKLHRQWIIRNLAAEKLNYEGGTPEYERLDALICIFGVVREANMMEQHLKIDFGTKDSKKKMFELVRCHAIARTETAFLVFDINPHLSTGEMAFLTMWGRIKSEYDKMVQAHHDMAPELTSKDRKKQFPVSSDGSIVPNIRDLVVFFDEAETSLHPTLQRRLITLSLWFFKKFLLNARAHLIFASHSPLLLSDIPVGNVCFLEKDVNGKVTAVAPDTLTVNGMSLSNTFGANIFDLYASSFCLKDGPIGAFATKKIQTLLDKVNARDESDHQQSPRGEIFTPEDNRILQLIGDKMIRRYFATMSYDFMKE